MRITAIVDSHQSFLATDRTGGRVRAAASGASTCPGQHLAGANTRRCHDRCSGNQVVVRYRRLGGPGQQLLEKMQPAPASWVILVVVGNPDVEVFCLIGRRQPSGLLRLHSSCVRGNSCARANNYVRANSCVRNSCVQGRNKCVRGQPSTNSSTINP